MPSLDILPFQPEHLPAAAALVSARYREFRHGRRHGDGHGNSPAVPLLPARYEDPGEFLSLLSNLAEREGGVAALQDGQLVGFLTGYILPEFLGGRSFYSPEWANAAILQNNQVIYEEMYTAASPSWLASGCHQHILTIFANDLQGIQAFQWLGFGYIVIDGLRSLQPIPMVSASPSLEVRAATLEDLPAVSSLIAALDRHMAAAPIFWPHHTEVDNWLQQPENRLWLAVSDHEILGGMGIGPASTEAAQIIVDPGTASIVSAYTWEHARCRGVASALLQSCLSWAQEQGYARCAVDYESSNRLARRFWSRHFDPVCYSLFRYISTRKNN